MSTHSLPSPDWRRTLARRGLDSPAECDRFLALARQVARARGKRGPGCICGYVGVATFMFEDELVQVTAAIDTPSLEIVFKYPDGTLTNPVVMVTESGEVIRVHGEHCYVVPHIECAASAAGLAVDRNGHG